MGGIQHELNELRPFRLGPIVRKARRAQCGDRLSRCVPNNGSERYDAVDVLFAGDCETLAADSFKLARQRAPLRQRMWRELSVGSLAEHGLDGRIVELGKQDLAERRAVHVNLRADRNTHDDRAAALHGMKINRLVVAQDAEIAAEAIKRSSVIMLPPSSIAR